MSNKQILVPDVGGGKVDVIEILVTPGTQVSKGDALVTVESDKASMDIPSPFDGAIVSIDVKVGNKLEEGSLVATIAATRNTAVKSTAAAPAKPAEISNPVEVKKTQPQNNLSSNFKDSLYAGPAVRRIAREFGIDLTQVNGTGEKNRITKEDVQNFVRSRLQGSNNSGINIAPAPSVDFTKFGEVEIKPLSKIKKFSGTNLHRNWVTIPHITQFDDADITDLEAMRQARKAEAEKQGVKLTLIVFVMKAVVEGLKKYPQFNASLDSSGENLIMKKYFNVGVAVDTPNGLVVPVIRDVDKKNVFELARELGDISKKAREKGLSPLDMQGSCFSISSLGGIGGTAFTPIVNAPDVAILGLSKTAMKPVWSADKFIPRLILPLSLSYDHRVIDGADGARFVTFLSECLKTLNA
jgi:pyruvate dehydrogenase E2 component (dihydrolipoamide acetyltransferase)